MNLLRSTDSGIIPVSFSSSASDSSSSLLTGISSYPKQLDESNGSYLEQNYDLLAGSYPTETTDIVLVIDSDNELDCQILNAMGFDTEGDETIKFDEVVGTEFRLINNNDYYEQTEYGTYMPSMDY